MISSHFTCTLWVEFPWVSRSFVVNYINPFWPHLSDGWINQFGWFWMVKFFTFVIVTHWTHNFWHLQYKHTKTILDPHVFWQLQAPVVFGQQPLSMAVVDRPGGPRLDPEAAAPTHLRHSACGVQPSGIFRVQPTPSQAEQLGPWTWLNCSKMFQLIRKRLLSRLSICRNSSHIVGNPKFSPCHDTWKVVAFSRKSNVALKVGMWQMLETSCHVQPPCYVTGHPSKLPQGRFVSSLMAASPLMKLQ